MRGPTIDVTFLFLGGAHHVLHVAPVAAELSRDRRFKVSCLVAGEAERAAVVEVLRAWPDASIAIEPLPAPFWGRWLGRLHPKLVPAKLPRLWHNRHRLAATDAIVTAERTSTIVRPARLTRARLLHIPHGAGDRSRGFEPRLKRFDFIVVSGEKDAARMIAAGLVSPQNVAVSGSIKLAALARLRSAPPRLFDDARPVVLYNPHFSQTLGSWLPWGRGILRAFAAQDEFNLIFAPHVRLFEAATAAEKDAVRALAVPGRILVDTGSDRCYDMTYTDAADLYLGDVSSQVYEFLSRPRPCVFLNAHGANWRDNPDYASWRYGEVVDAPGAVLDAVRRARARHAEFLPLQQAGVEAALGRDWIDAPAHAAAAIADYLLRERPELQALPPRVVVTAGAGAAAIPARMPVEVRAPSADP